MLAFFGPHHDGVSARPKLPHARTMMVVAATSASFRSGECFIFSSVRVGFSLLDDVHGPSDGVNADTKTQSQGLDYGLSRIRHTNCECELAKLVEEEGRDDGRDRKTTTAKQRRSAENDNSDRRQEQRIALECSRFAGDAGHQDACHAI